MQRARQNHQNAPSDHSSPARRRLHDVQTPRRKANVSPSSDSPSQLIDSSLLPVGAAVQHTEFTAAHTRPFVQGPLEGNVFGSRTTTVLPAYQSVRAEDVPIAAGTPMHPMYSREDGAREARADHFRAMIRSPVKITPISTNAAPSQPLSDSRLEDSFAITGVDADDPFAVKVWPHDNQRRASSTTSEDDDNKEWPPSPKKSPIKRKLQFRQPSQQTSQQQDVPRWSGQAGEETEHEDEDDSMLAALESKPVRHSRCAGPKVSTTQQAGVPQSNQSDDRAAPVRPRPRKSLMRRRRPTNVHEDPASPEIIRSDRQPKAPETTDDLLADVMEVENGNSMGDVQAPGLVEVQDTPNKAEAARQRKVEDRLWDACGGDVARWNRGDFGSHVVALGIGKVRW